MSKVLSRSEVKNWINFLYEDLLKDRIYIGGYYFFFSQLENFNKMEDIFTKKLCKEILSPSQHIKKDINSSYKAPQRAQNSNLNEDERIIVNITTINKFNEKVEFPCTHDEFLFVLKDLTQAKNDVEHFKEFLLDELKQVKEEDLGTFMCFINDLLDEIRQKFSTGKSSIIF